MIGFFICGIHTGIGKTIVSAVLAQALKADYWKPVQTGGLDLTDSDLVRTVAPCCSMVHPEAYRLKEPVSPHRAAELEGITIGIEQIHLPQTSNTLIVESAGGVLSPLNERQQVADLAKQLGLPVILVSMHYLGSINHTLMSAEVLLNRNIPIAGIVFNGRPDPVSEKYILEYTGLKNLGSVSQTDKIDVDFISEQSKKFEYLHELVG